mmetsp:Transcript_92050/g.204288  ORF Transcript_92050/g.204288 Transcript_92050/m.204288 type:complete len:335 (-) Transcript_92050:112-1116(-)
MACSAFSLLALSGVFAWSGASAGTSEDEWLSFPSPSGVVRIHRDCVHHVEGVFHVANSAAGDTLSAESPSGEGVTATKVLSPCPHLPRRLNASAQITPQRLGYYSDWAAYAQSTHMEGFGLMSSEWTVPAAPASTGPIPGMSSAYLFNGLENSGGHSGTATFIMQPVLSYGKSGCILNPINFFQWHFISFLVTDAGRAYCGSRLSVEEGEQLRGSMRLGTDGRRWTIEAKRLKTNQTSTYSTDLGGKKANAAYATLETMVNYNCKAFPASGSTTFGKNVLADMAGRDVNTEWVKKVPHTECGQRVDVDESGNVKIAWNTVGAGDIESPELPVVV